MSDVTTWNSLIRRAPALKPDKPTLEMAQEYRAIQWLVSQDVSPTINYGMMMGIERGRLCPEQVCLWTVVVETNKPDEHKEFCCQWLSDALAQAVAFVLDASSPDKARKRRTPLNKAK